MTKISDASNNQVAWTYNTAGLVTNETTRIPTDGSESSSIASSVNYGYDTFGRNVSTQLSVNGVLQYTDAMGYDLRNRMSSLVRTGSGNANENMWTTFQFNNLDQIVGSRRGSGATAGSNLELIQTITRDQIGRPTQIAYTANNPGGTSPLDSYSMQYVSGSDRLASQTTPAGTTTYSYTPGGQLSRAGTVNYAYDANGNATSRGGVSTIVGSFNRMMDDGAFTFAYDAEGRTTSRTNKQSGEIERYQWNQVSQLTQVNVSPNSSTPATSRSIRYGYDQVGRRSSIAQAASPLSAASSVDYLLSDGDQLAQILGASGAVTSRFMYGSAVDSVLSEQTFGSGGATSAKWQLTDHLGSVRGVAQKQAGGNTSSINQVQYDAFGKITSQTNVGNQPRFGFAGRDIESVGGMTYNRNRYYSTSSGRFISQDPMSFNAGDENLYRYVGNSPTNFTDPSGLHYRVVLAPAIPSLPQGPNNPLKEWREDDLDVWWKQQNAQSNSSAPTPSGPSMRAKTPEEILESHYDIYSELMQHQHSLDVILEGTGIDLTQQRREIERLIARDAPEFLDSYHRGRLGLHSERVANSLLMSMNSRISLPSPQTRSSIVPNPTFGTAPVKAVPQGHSRAYRAVSEAEYQDIIKSGKLRQGPNSMEGKWFADSPAGAKLHGDALEGVGKYRVIEVDIPNNLRSLHLDPNLDLRGPARYLDGCDLPGLAPRPFGG